MRKYLKQSIIFCFTLCLCLNLFPYNIIKASTFSNATYEDSRDYAELESRIVSESSKQSLEFFQMVSYWEIYGSNEQEQYDSLKKYIAKTKERFSFINEYNTSLSNEIKDCFNNYSYLMDQESSKNISNFINGPVVFIDFLEKNLSETQGNFLSFKKDGLNKFLDTFIYTNDNKIAINKIMNGSSSDKEVGIATLNKTIEKLEEINTKMVEKKDNENKIKKEYATPEVIRNFSNQYQKYYNQVINNDFSMSKSLLLTEKYRIEGLIPVGIVSEEIVEFNLYSSVFNEFTDYPTIDLALKLDSKKIAKTLKTVNSQELKTTNVQELKKLHYEFLYQLSEYKKTNNKEVISKAYVDFYNKYSYLKLYYSKCNQRFGNFNSSMVLTELSKSKEKAKCINPNFEEINNLNYNPNFTKDNNSYREFLVNKDISSYVKKGLFLVLIIIVLISLILLIKKINDNKRNNRLNNGYEEDDYYD